ncbi:hypothetical protein QJ043_04555 [Olsenella sp. YH-ols2217]|uniref:Uncharacterized protein n=1 Tax=Kribbibacterium absianum TaxID=3044210 RepID=A0ABT6ZJW7_9ACTN|nr:hypothetical protein [Olsenella sp. YH-ols2217]MDJ1122398.1 hypothetical protein [Olsenella sp. YH-ols2216]MDJ1129348.1 hypothetical protein [Olsenella sp. YH-ols2217]
MALLRSTGIWTVALTLAGLAVWKLWRVRCGKPDQGATMSTGAHTVVERREALERH